MKVCDVAQLYSPQGGGWRRYLEDKAAWAAASGAFEHVLVRPGKTDGLDRRPGSHRYELASPLLPGARSHRVLVRMKALAAILENERPDVVEVGDPYLVAWICSSLGRRAAFPVVAFHHSDLPRVIAPMRRYLVATYARCDAVVVANPRTERALRRLGVGNLVTIPLGVDTDRFRPRPLEAARLRRELHLAPGESLILYAGRLAREKRLRELVAAIDEFVAQGGRCRLLVVGSGELEAWLDTAAAVRPYLERRPFVGDAETLAAYYTAADLFVHAGRNETFGLGAVEARACGTPVVAVRGSGLEFALSGEPGSALATSATPSDLAATIRTALAARRLGDAARRRSQVEERFSLDRTFRTLTRLYEHVASQRTAPESVVA